MQISSYVQTKNCSWNYAIIILYVKCHAPLFTAQTGSELCSSKVLNAVCQTVLIDFKFNVVKVICNGIDEKCLN